MPSASQSRPDAAAPRARRRGRSVAIAVAVIVFMTFAGLVLPRWVGSRIATQRPPSIVFVLVDTLRADYLGTYGFDGPVSPNLDRLAEESVVFERAFAQAPWTKPSIASLFTSLAPETHGVLAHDGKYVAPGGATTTEALSQDATTLAESLAAAGYETAAFVANPWLKADHGFAQGFATWTQPQGFKLPVRAPLLLGAAGKWLAARDPAKPFFLYVHLMDVHGPYVAPDTDYDAVRESPGLGPSRPLTTDERARLLPYLLRTRWADTPEANDVRTWRARYAAGVHAADRALGSFLNGLTALGVLDDAIVVVTSDHGEELADHGAWDHGLRLYDEQIRVPLILRLPGGASGGQRVREVVSLIDVMPTLLARAGAAAPPAMQGRDLSPLLDEDEAGTPGGASFASGVKWQPRMRSLRTPEWKLIADGDAARLFDVARDPGEQQDLAATRPDERRALVSELEAHERKLGEQPALAREEAPVSDEMKRRLEALGYAH